MQSLGERNADATLYLVHLVEQHLVVHQHFDVGEVGYTRLHVLHSGGEGHHLLRHAVAHREPLQLEEFLRELLVLVLVRHLSLLLRSHSLLAL